MTINNLQAFDAAIRAVAPIDGVSADGKTIWFQESATEAQKAAAHAAAAAFVDSEPASAVVPQPPLQELPRPKSITEA
jgi:hypothetical protein